MQKQVKICSECKKGKLLKEFSPDKRRKDGCSRYCRECRSLHARIRYAKNPEYFKSTVKKWRKNNPEKVYKSKRNWGLKSNYGITIEDYNKIFKEQQGCCSICGKHQSEMKRVLVVDHDHKNGKVRSLLCDRCNNGLGYIEDTNYLIKAQQYLNENNS